MLTLRKELADRAHVVGKRRGGGRTCAAQRRRPSRCSCARTGALCGEVQAQAHTGRPLRGTPSTCCAATTVPVPPCPRILKRHGPRAFPFHVKHPPRPALPARARAVGVLSLRAPTLHPRGGSGRGAPRPRSPRRIAPGIAWAARSHGLVPRQGNTRTPRVRQVHEGLLEAAPGNPARSPHHDLIKPRREDGASIAPASLATSSGWAV